MSFDEIAEDAQGWAADEASCPMRAAAHQQRLQRLAEALRELPERQREAFVLSRFDGLTQDEIAARMDISRRMVVKHLARAIAYCEVRVHYATAVSYTHLSSTMARPLGPISNRRRLVSSKGLAREAPTREMRRPKARRPGARS